MPCSRFGEIARVAGSATTFTNSGLASRKSYSYRVRAYNGTGWSPYSASVTAADALTAQTRPGDEVSS